MRKPDLPKGVAAYFIHGKDDPSQGVMPDTVCVLVKAEGPNNNKLPSTVSKWEVLSAGICFFSPKDDFSKLDYEKAEVIALGRALKSYNKANSVNSLVLNKKYSYTTFPALPLSA